MAEGEFRCRICYAKTGRLRFLSHLEISHSLDRAVRRAALPYAVTRGFNPHMKLAFGPALPTGSAGEQEYVDIWFTEFLPPSEIRERLASALPGELAPIEVRFVGIREPSLAAECTIVLYEVSVVGEGVETKTLQQVLDDIVSGGELQVEHKGKTKVFDLARSLPKEICVRSTESGMIVEMTIRMGPEGSLRPDVLIVQALSRIGSAGVVTTVTRRDTLIESDQGWRRPI